MSVINKQNKTLDLLRPERDSDQQLYNGIGGPSPDKTHTLQDSINSNLEPPACISSRKAIQIRLGLGKKGFLLTELIGLSHYNV